MSEQLALFIDFENIAIWAAQENVDLEIKHLIGYLEERGAVVVKRAYADWSHFNRYRDDLLGSSMELTQVYNTNASGNKNRADMWMTVDALETAIARPNIETMVIVSGDSDFGPLVSKLREYGRYVIGVGPQSGTHHLLIKACDEFVYLDHLLGVAEQPQELSPEKQASFHLLREALEVFVERDALPVLATRLKQKMLSMDASFDEAALGYRQFSAFLEDSGLVKLYKRDQQVFAAPPDFVPPEEYVPEFRSAATPETPADQRAHQRNPVSGVEEPVLPPGPVVDLKTVLFDRHPSLAQVIQDVLSVDLGGIVERGMAGAEQLANKGMAARTHDFSAASDYFIKASRLMWQAAEQAPEDDNAGSRLRWMMASYASCRSAEISHVNRDYSAARPYYLSFFALADMMGSQGEDVGGLARSMLKHYWWNIGRELGIQFAPAASPAEIAVQAARHQNRDIREMWQEVTGELALVNPALLREVAGEMLRDQEGTSEGVEVARYIERIIGDQTAPHAEQTPADQPAGVPEAEFEDTLHDLEEDLSLKVLFDDLKDPALRKKQPSGGVKAAHKLMRKAAVQRDENLVKAARKMRIACSILYDAATRKKKENLIGELRCFLAEYAAARAEALSKVKQRYADARAYDLAFFSLVQVGSPTWDKMRGLVKPALKRYWLDAGFELGLQPDPASSPVKVAVFALAYSSDLYRQRWTEITRDLAHVNPGLLHSFVSHLKKKSSARGRLVATEIEKILEVQDS